MQFVFCENVDNIEKECQNKGTFLNRISGVMKKDDINEELLDKYLKLAHLLNKEENWLPRLEKGHETVLQHYCQYDA